MKKEYLEPKQTLQSLKNLGAETKFVSYEEIFNEFMNIRGSKEESLTKRSLNNLKGRVRRILVFDKKTVELKERTKTLEKGSQPKELSISLKFPKYLVKSKHPITIKNNGDIKYSSEVEENYFKLIKINTENEFVYADEIVIDENEKIFFEGKVKNVTVNNYERNPKARKKCIEHYGVKCMICYFDFEKTYGEIGENFIHVHHKIDIATIGNEYSVNPLTDLIPVCPNCHSMLHKKKPAYSIEELKKLIKKTNPNKVYKK